MGMKKPRRTRTMTRMKPKMQMKNKRMQKMMTAGQTA
jgi:hypothetical protein